MCSLCACIQARRVFFGDGVRFDLAAPRSRPLVGCTQIILSRLYHGRDGGGATVLKVRVAYHSRKKIGPHFFAYARTQNITLHSIYYCNYNV